MSRLRPALVRIETSGNQAYIFASNRLRQNVGASELVLRCCSQWVLEAVAQITGRALWDPSVQERTERLRNPTLNPYLGKAGNRVEVMTATSGSATLLVEDCSLGCELVEKVTRRALREAPGLAVAGAVVSMDGREGFQQAFQQAGAELARVRSRLPLPEARFRQIPIVDRCRTTGLPAAVYDVPFGGEPPEPLSAVARAKLMASQLTQARLLAEHWVRDRNRLARSMAELERALGQVEERWLAVIHADGNGFGALLGRLAQAPDGRDRVETLRWVSTGLERTAVRAFDRALTAAVTVWDNLFGTADPLVVPLVLGGDDLTVVCEGTLAMPFTIAYLRGFETESANELGTVLDPAGQQLTASAGVALVKPHYPFHAAYDLAELLTESAKLVKDYAPGCSALDVHLQLDTTDADLDRIRQRRRSRNPVEDLALWGGPYVLEPEGGHPPGGWASMHALERLGQVVRALQRREDERPVVSASLAHRLRSALARGRTEADAELARLRRTHPGKVWSELTAAGDGTSLTRPERGLRAAVQGSSTTKVPAYATALLDAMDLAGLWDGEAGKSTS
jgi:hypothetical protein